MSILIDHVDWKKIRFVYPAEQQQKKTFSIHTEGEIPEHIFVQNPLLYTGVIFYLWICLKAVCMYICVM